VFGVAAEAAGGSGGVDDPPFVVGGDLLAGGGHVGEDRAAEEVVASVGAVNSFPIVGGIVEGLSIDFVDGFVADPGLIEADAIGVAVDGRVYCHDKTDQCHKEY
jgi:hypothetical protein